MAGAVGGTFAGKEAPHSDVDLNPVLARDGIDFNVYKVSMSINPAAGTRYSLHFANSATQKVIKSLGVEVRPV